MAIKYETKWFGKTGRGVAQVAQVTEDGVAVLENGQPVMGNEQFSCNQLSADSLDVADPSDLFSEALEVSGNDVKVLREMILKGANRYFREQASGTDEVTKLARQIVSKGFGQGKTALEVAAEIKAGTFKLVA